MSICGLRLFVVTFVTTSFQLVLTHRLRRVARSPPGSFIEFAEMMANEDLVAAEGNVTTKNIVPASLALDVPKVKKLIKQLTTMVGTKEAHDVSESSTDYIFSGAWQLREKAEQALGNGTLPKLEQVLVEASLWKKGLATRLRILSDPSADPHPGQTAFNLLRERKTLPLDSQLAVLRRKQFANFTEAKELLAHHNNTGPPLYEQLAVLLRRDHVEVNTSSDLDSRRSWKKTNTVSSQHRASGKKAVLANATAAVPL